MVPRCWLIFSYYLFFTNHKSQITMPPEFHPPMAMMMIIACTPPMDVGLSIHAINPRLFSLPRRWSYDILSYLYVLLSYSGSLVGGNGVTLFHCGSYRNLDPLFISHLQPSLFPLPSSLSLSLSLSLPLPVSPYFGPSMI